MIVQSHVDQDAEGDARRRRDRSQAPVWRLADRHGQPQGLADGDQHDRGGEQAARTGEVTG